VVSTHFTVVETTEAEIAMISVEGRLEHILLPKKRMLFWKDAAPVSVEVLTLIGEPELPEPMLASFERPGQWSDTDPLIEDAIAVFYQSDT
jgi:hypothetical protein